MKQRAPLGSAPFTPNPERRTRRKAITTVSIPDTTKRIAEYQRLACDLFDRIQAMDVEINAHLVKGQLDRAVALGRKKDQLVAQRRSAFASIKQLKHAELLNPGLPRRRKSDLVTR